ncbi:hypothetical protein [Lysinibacillus xylanilyticus]|uniref:hypothetical protein n=1 Tax=Lysinibacillus xylanilyticus TaxID=582475 RepID=UPI00380BC044
MTPWGSANRGTKAKSITSCDNAFVTNIVLLLSLRFRAKDICWLCESEASATNVLSARKRSGSDKSTQPERKSTSRYGDESFILKRW